ncbi:MAG TPA: CsbD family protein [Steroidobacteraceae bacterium]|nr:CsbD family protein [Steroidobacteraceae bacterium]
MSINKDQVKGRFAKAAGGLKEAAGKITGDARLQADGNAQKNLGKLRSKYGNVQQYLKKGGK